MDIGADMGEPTRHPRTMQRLYSMFPGGRPGIALLLVRVALGLLLMDGVGGRLVHQGSPWLLLAPGAVALALVAGLVLPIAVALCILLEGVIVATSPDAIRAVHVCAIIDSIAVGLLGPGAYSLDAKLFGRKRIVFRSDPDEDPR